MGLQDPSKLHHVQSNALTSCIWLPQAQIQTCTNEEMTKHWYAKWNRNKMCEASALSTLMTMPFHAHSGHWMDDALFSGGNVRGLILKRRISMSENLSCLLATHAVLHCHCVDHCLSAFWARSMLLPELLLLLQWLHHHLLRLLRVLTNLLILPLPAKLP